MEDNLYDVIIIGSGPAGLTAAIYATRASLQTVVIGGMKWGGQLQLTTDVENFPGFPEGIQGPDLMTAMRKQAEKFGVEFVQSDMDPTDFSKMSGGPFTVVANGKSYIGKTLLIATGADAKTLGVPGEKELTGHGISYCATCDGAFFRNKNIIVVGGGDSAMEEANFLTNFASKVTLVHRRDKFKASEIMVDRAKKNPKIEFLLNTQIVEVLGQGKVEKVKFSTVIPTAHSVIPARQSASGGKAGIQEDGSPYRVNRSGMTIEKGGTVIKETSEEIIWELPIDGVFVAIGHIPNSKVFGGVEITERGYIKAQKGTYTNIKGIFVSGDVEDAHYQQAVVAAGFGCMAALDIQAYLAEKP